MLWQCPRINLLKMVDFVDGVTSGVRVLRSVALSSIVNSIFKLGTSGVY